MEETACKPNIEYRWRLKSPRCQFTPHFAHCDWLLRTLGPPLRSHRVRDKREQVNQASSTIYWLFYIHISINPTHTTFKCWIITIFMRRKEHHQ